MIPVLLGVVAATTASADAGRGIVTPTTYVMKQKVSRVVTFSSTGTSRQNIDRKRSYAVVSVVVPNARGLVLRVTALDHGRVALSWDCWRKSAGAPPAEGELAVDVMTVGFAFQSDGSTTTSSTTTTEIISGEGRVTRSAPFTLKVSGAQCGPGRELLASAARDDRKPFTLTLLGSR